MTTPQYSPTASSPIAGGLITSTVTFTAIPSNVITDPTTITVKVQQGGTTTTYVYPNAFITKVSTGVYSCEIDTTGQSGYGTVEWIGTGAVQAINAVAWNTTPAPI